MVVEKDQHTCLFLCSTKLLRYLGYSVLTGASLRNDEHLRV